MWSRRSSWAALALVGCGSTHSGGGIASGGGGGSAGAVAAAGGAAMAAGQPGTAGNNSAGSSGAAPDNFGGSGQGGASNQTGGSAGQGSGGSSAGGSNFARGGITIFANLFHAATGLRAVSVNPSFPALNPQPSTSTCSSETHGACSMSRCTPGAASAPVPSAGYEHVGAISVDSEEAGVHVVMTPDANGAYSETENSMMGFSGGELIKVTASGGTRPGFALDAPFSLILLVATPVPPAAVERVSTITLPRGQDATLTWTRGVPDVLFHAQTTGGVKDENGASVFLQCSFDSLAGTGTIEAAALSFVPTGTRLALYTVWSSNVAASNTDVYVVAESAIPERTAKVELLLQ